MCIRDRVVTRVVKEDVDSDEGGILYFLSPPITICHSAASSELVSLRSKEPCILKHVSGADNLSTARSLPSVGIEAVFVVGYLIPPSSG